MQKQSPVIKKVKKITHHGGHGSSWKVAFADFMTAMMAFFLMMWLISSLKPEQKESISSYFQNFNLLDKSEFLDSLAKHMPPPPPEIQIAEYLKNEILEKLMEVKDQIMVEIFPGGVKIQVIDNIGNPIFSLGGVEPTESAKDILKVIAANIKNLNAQIAIEGHTDAVSYVGQKFTNWELSTARASAARIVLEKEGISPDRLVRVSGFAATAPLFKDNPFNPLNRRISILLFFNPTAQTERSQGIQTSAKPESHAPATESHEPKTESESPGH
jgi:chemotaxis protein MotB